MFFHLTKKISRKAAKTQRGEEKKQRKEADGKRTLFASSLLYLFSSLRLGGFA
jgi:hypothetical protein